MESPTPFLDELGAREDEFTMDSLTQDELLRVQGETLLVLKQAFSRQMAGLQELYSGIGLFAEAANELNNRAGVALVVPEADSAE